MRWCRPTRALSLWRGGSVLVPRVYDLLSCGVAASNGGGLPSRTDDSRVRDGVCECVCVCMACVVRAPHGGVLARGTGRVGLWVDELAAGVSGARGREACGICAISAADGIGGGGVVSVACANKGPLRLD